MPEEITITVGSVYAQLHENYTAQIGDAYEQRARDEFEDFIHEFNKQIERETERSLAEQSKNAE